MWLKGKLLFKMLLMLLTQNRVSGQDYGTCVNPRGQSGLCVPIKMCDPLLNLLRAYGKEAGEFLRQSVCVYENSNPIVCCPIIPNNNFNNTRQPINHPTNTNHNSNNLNINNNNKPNNGNNINNNPPGNTYGPLSSPVCGHTDAKFTRIVNGVPAKLGFWPWVALLGYRSKNNPYQPRYLCGGALISARHVLTAGHCVYDRNDLYLVRLGELDIADDNDGATPIDFGIERRTIHPEYSPTAYTSDVAVLKLHRDVEFTSLIKPICLPVNEDIRSVNLHNKFPFVVGWGSKFYNGPTSSQLQQLQVPVVDQADCATAYNGKGATIDSRVLCAGYAEGGKDACQGDSGGPLMFPVNETWYSIGVVSFGFRCALPGFPGVYSKTQSFLNFIIPLLN